MIVTARCQTPSKAIGIGPRRRFGQRLYVYHEHRVRRARRNETQAADGGRTLEYSRTRHVYGLLPLSAFGNPLFDRLLVVILGCVIVLAAADHNFTSNLGSFLFVAAVFVFWPVYLLLYPDIDTLRRRTGLRFERILGGKRAERANHQ